MVHSVVVIAKDDNDGWTLLSTDHSIYVSKI